MDHRALPPPIPLPDSDQAPGSYGGRQTEVGFCLLDHAVNLVPKVLGRSIPIPTRERRRDGSPVTKRHCDGHSHRDVDRSLGSKTNFHLRVLGSLCCSLVQWGVYDFCDVLPNISPKYGCDHAALHPEHVSHLFCIIEIGASANEKHIFSRKF
jgi:hypothetical protein